MDIRILMTAALMAAALQALYRAMPAMPQLMLAMKEQPNIMAVMASSIRGYRQTCRRKAGTSRRIV